VGSDQIADVTGAGDTVIATFTTALACGASFSEAARLANFAGGLVVMKRGTATVTSRELAAAVRADRSR
jgi:bifunctional ADP-heptose synthase (sugar kinase/adenylyltransferase)